MAFNGYASLSNGALTLQGSALNSALAGDVTFADASNAGMGTLTVNGGSAAGGNAGNVHFVDASSAGGAAFTLNGGGGKGAQGGKVDFSGQSSAGAATFTIQRGNVTGAAGAEVRFNEQSSAAGAVMNVGSGVSGTSSGSVTFSDVSSAGAATITNAGSSTTGNLIAGTAGGMTFFRDQSSGGAATLIAQGGISGGAGSAIVFLDQSRGDLARVQVSGNARLDISLHAADEVGVGSLEGNGNAFVGSKVLVVGANGMNTTFAGAIQDDGAVFDVTGIHASGGGLLKSGGGTTTLTGVTTYTGMTGVEKGSLIVDLVDNASVLNSVSELHLGGGTIRLRGKAGTASSQVLDGLTLHAGASRVEVENTGTATTLDLASTGIARLDGGTVDFTAASGVLGTTAIVKTAQPNDSSGAIGAWATVNGGSALAANNGSGVIVPYTAYTDIGSSGTTIANGATTNVRINTGASAGVVVLGAASTSINTLTQAQSFAATVDTSGKTLSMTGVLLSPASGALTIGTSAGSGALTAPGELVLNNNSAQLLTVNASITGSTALTTSGNTTLNAGNSYTGVSNVGGGTLTVDGSIASSLGVNLAAGATLSGHGAVSAVGGSGTLAPGNSPGIMSAASIDPSGGLQFQFQFTKTGAPLYLSPGASGNDLLRLGSLTPFTNALTSQNKVTVDFSAMASLSTGDVFLGGFYADNGGDFFAKIEHADFHYTGLAAGQRVTVQTLPSTADFGSGNVNGYISQFTITATEATLTPATLDPASVTGTVLHITGLDNAETVIVERLLDANGNGSVDSIDTLVESFTVTDGQVSMIAGVRNTNVAGDDDGGANGQLSVTITPLRGPEVGRLESTQLIRVSSPTSHFPSFTRVLTLTDAAQAQSISGTVTDGTNPVPFAAVVLLDEPSGGRFVAGGMSNAAGQFTIDAPPGIYSLFAAKSGFVAPFEGTTVVNLPPSSHPVQNLLMTAATTSISGAVIDDSTLEGVGGVQVFVSSSTGLVAIGFTNLDGTFSVPVTAGNWHLEPSEMSLHRHGFLALEDSMQPSVSTQSGAITGVYMPCHRASALVHGFVTAPNATPVANVAVNVNGSMMSMELAFTDATGHYVAGVVDGSWLVALDEQSLNGYLAPEPQSVTINGTQAALRNFSLIAVTAHITGTVLQSGNPAGGLRVEAHNDATDRSVMVTSHVDGTYDIGVTAGNWIVELQRDTAANLGVMTSTTTVPVTDGQTVSGINVIVLSGTSNVTGTVTDAGQPVTGATLHGMAAISGTTYSSYAATDPGGNYQLPVTNGSWTIQVEDVGDYSQPAPASAPISDASLVRHFQLTKLPVIWTQPVDQSTMAGQTSNFSVVVSSGTAATFQWQVSTDNGFNWSHVANNATYSGATSDNVQIITSQPLSGNRYRCMITNTFGSVSSNVATLTVTTGTAADSWRQLYFGSSGNSGDAADTAAPDHDNIVNLLKYALVIAPGTSGAASLPAVQPRSYAEGPRLSFTFIRDPARNDVTLDVQSSGNLSGPWTTVATSVNGAPFTGAGYVGETNGPGSYKTVEVRDTVNIGATDARFMRIRVSR